MRILAALTLVGAGCYQPPRVASCTLECPEAECPEGTECFPDGYCHEPDDERLCAAGATLEAFASGGSGLEEPLGIAVDHDQIVVGGYYVGDFGYVTADAGDSDQHGFVISYDHGGGTRFAVDFGSSGPSEVTVADVALLDDGSIVAVGQGDPAGTLWVDGDEVAGCNGAFAARIASDSSLLWIHCEDAPGGAEGVDLDDAGTAYVAGWIQASDPEPQVFTISADGVPGWNTVITRAGSDAFHDVAFSAAGVFAVGQTTGAEEDGLVFRLDPATGESTLVTADAAGGTQITFAVALGTPLETSIWFGGLMADDLGFVGLGPQSWGNPVNGVGAVTLGLALSSDETGLLACGAGHLYAGAPIEPDVAAAGGPEAFVLGVEAATGSRLWGRLLASPGREVATACTMHDGLAYVTGAFQGSIELAPHLLQTAGTDLFVAVIETGEPL